MAARKKTRRQLFYELLRARCDDCGDVTSVIHYDRVTRTGRKVRKKSCIGCFTGRY